MIRRGFWLAVGAAGGIMGYRRVSSLGRQVSEKLGGRHGQLGQPGQPSRQGAVKRHWARETIRFTRDVREGMDVYIDRQRARSAPTLGKGAGHALNGIDHDRHNEREDH
jgi:hypothetical protein